MKSVMASLLWILSSVCGDDVIVLTVLCLYVVVFDDELTPKSENDSNISVYMIKMQDAHDTNDIRKTIVQIYRRLKTASVYPKRNISCPGCIFSRRLLKSSTWSSYCSLNSVSEIKRRKR